jgi:2Fe-2S ferredoxin
MSLITFKPSGNTYEAAEGSTILAAMLAAGEKVTHKCDGKASCGECHFFLLEGRKGVSRLSPEENSKLDMMVGISSKSRLACQATVLGTEDITIEVLSFV